MKRPLVNAGAQGPTRKVLQHISGATARPQVNSGTDSNNPKYYVASRLEGKKAKDCYQPVEPTAIVSKGEPRNNINHAYNRDESYHSHMGASKAGHKYPGRRV